MLTTASFSDGLSALLTLFFPIKEPHFLRSPVLKVQSSIFVYPPPEMATPTRHVFTAVPTSTAAAAAAAAAAVQITTRAFPWTR